MQQPELLINGNYYHISSRGINNCTLFRGTDNYEHFADLIEKYITPVAHVFAWVLMPDHFHFLVRIKEHIGYKYSKEDKIHDPLWFEQHKWEIVDLSACKAPDSVETILGSESDSQSVTTFEAPVNTNVESAISQFSSITTPIMNSHVTVNSADLAEKINILNDTDTINSSKIPKPHLHFSHLFNAYSKYINEHYGRHGSLFERPFKRKLINDETFLKEVVLYIHYNPVQHGHCKHPDEYSWSSYLNCISEKPAYILTDKVTDWFGNEAHYKTLHNTVPDIRSIENGLRIY